MPASFVTLERARFTASMSRDLDWAALPESLRELERIVGPEGALALAGRFGGSTIYVPSTLLPNHPLAACLGRERAASLAAVYGGDRLNVPKQDAALRQLREKRIALRRGEGASVADLAGEFGLSRRRVLQILAGFPKGV